MRAVTLRGVEPLVVWNEPRSRAAEPPPAATPAEAVLRALGRFSAPNRLLTSFERGWMMDGGGSSLPALVVVVSGVLQVRLSTEDASTATAGIALAGDVIPSDGWPAEYVEVRAVTSGVCFLIPAAMCRRKTETSAEMARAMAWVAASWVSRIGGRLVEVTCHGASTRLARLLLEIDGRGSQPGVPLIPQGVLAELIGASRETVNRTTSEFRRRRWIERDGHHYVLLDRAALRAEARVPEAGLGSW